jgi:pterin-4a-carbinolamine dehydratase
MTSKDLLPAATISDALSRDLRRWRLDGAALKRLYKVNGFRSALVVANAIGHMAEAAWHHPDLAISWGKVEVTLWSHDAGGVTARDLELARRIEEMIAWRPARGSALEGAPDDERFAYVLPD